MRGPGPIDTSAPGCLAHCFKNSEPGFPVSRGHERHEPDHRLAVTGEHNFLPCFGEAQKLGKLCFGVGY